MNEWERKELRGEFTCEIVHKSNKNDPLFISLATRKRFHMALYTILGHYYCVAAAVPFSVLLTHLVS